MATATTRPNSPDSCVAGMPPGYPEPELRTADVVLTWDKVEPKPGQYDWSTLHTAITLAKLANGRLSVMLWTSQLAPLWLYDAPFDVPKLAHNADGSSVVPDYTSATYLDRLKGVHAALAGELRRVGGMPQLMAFQPCVGSTGDDTPIHVSSEGGHASGWTYVNKTLLAIINGPGGSGGGGSGGGSGPAANASWWNIFFRDFATWIATNESALGAEVAAGVLAPMLNAQGSSFALDWVEAHLPGSFLKLGQTGHEYQANYERYRIAYQVPYTWGLQRGRPVRARAELSAETCWTCPDGLFCNATACPVNWNVYAMAQFVSSAHLDFWNVQPNAVAGVLTAFRPLWRFLDRYAGLRWAWQARGAWIGFRDGLDALDTSRFDEETFGRLELAPASHASGDSFDGSPTIQCVDANTARARKICAAHAAQGCEIDVAESLCGGPMTQRRARGMNDVAFGNWRGDYGFLMRQLQPDANSRGHWRVGANRSALFGRFGRGFADPTNASGVIALKLDGGLWGGLPLAPLSSRRLTLRLVFLDVEGASFAVGYDAHGGAATVARVTTRGSGQWRELCVPLTDGRFGGGGVAGSDIWLANGGGGSGGDVVFDSLELAEGEPAELALAGCDWSEAEHGATLVEDVA